MNGRERVRKALRREEPDRPPIDLGSTPVTGIAASTYYRVRQALCLGDHAVTIGEPFQILAEVEEPVRRALGVDTIGIWSPTNFFGFRNEGWKPWTLPDGTPGLVPRDFQMDVDASGDTLIYPKGDRAARPSARLPKGGYYFDAIVRQDPIDEDHLDPQDWAEQFTVFTDEDLRYFEDEVTRLHRDTDYAPRRQLLAGRPRGHRPRARPRPHAPEGPARPEPLVRVPPHPRRLHPRDLRDPGRRRARRTSSSTARSWGTGSRCW